MPFKFLRAKFNGDPNIGLYGFATDDYCLLGLEPNKKILRQIKKILKTDIKFSTIAGTELSGIFVAGNKNGIILPKIIEKYELKNLKKMFDLNFEIIKSRQTALGNLILCNDKGCLISGKLRRFKKKISDVLDCEVEAGTIANLDIVGSAATSNNIGCLCHREATEEEMEKIEELLKVKVDVGTAGYGSPFIRSGIIVNSKGVVFSELSTGPEIGRFEEVFS
ncbi:MAG: translation initiation factor IF-6 [Candidatus Aenigmarchaeota archaeon]|nr:translation initiation factor IF-6 [Candidatus Aenigmarchaeota archaeon]